MRGPDCGEAMFTNRMNTKDIPQITTSMIQRAFPRKHVVLSAFMVRRIETREKGKGVGPGSVLSVVAFLILRFFLCASTPQRPLLVNPKVPLPQIWQLTIPRTPFLHPFS